MTAKRMAEEVQDVQSELKKKLEQTNAKYKAMDKYQRSNIFKRLIQ